MNNSIWRFDEQKNSEIPPIKILRNYANLLEQDTKGLVVGKVIENISQEFREVQYSLYLVVPKLKNYSYRLIEITQQDPFSFYPVNMSLYGSAPGNVETIMNVTGEQFKDRLIEFIQHPITRLILSHIKTHIEINEEYVRGL